MTLQKGDLSFYLRNIEQASHQSATPLPFRAFLQTASEQSLVLKVLASSVAPRLQGKCFLTMVLVFTPVSVQFASAYARVLVSCLDECHC